MVILSRDAILGAMDLATEDVDVPEWGGTVRIRTLTAAERDTFDASLSKGTGNNRTLDLANLRARLLALCIVNDDGSPVFSADDIAALGAKASLPLGRVFEAAQKLNGMLPTAVEDAVKN